MYSSTLMSYIVVEARYVRVCIITAVTVRILRHIFVLRLLTLSHNRSTWRRKKYQSTLAYMLLTKIHGLNEHGRKKLGERTTQRSRTRRSPDWSHPSGYYFFTPVFEEFKAWNDSKNNVYVAHTNREQDTTLRACKISPFDHFVTQVAEEFRA